MALIPQVIDVPFGLGIDTKTDEKNVLPGKLITLENGQFDKVGRVSKRPGLVAFTPTPVTSVSPTTGTLTADRDRLVVRTSAFSTSGCLSVIGKAGEQGQALSGASVLTSLVGDALSASGSQSCTGVDVALDTVQLKHGMMISVEAGVGSTVCLFDFQTKKPLVQSYTADTTIRNGRILFPALTGGVFPDVFITGTHNSANTLSIDLKRSDGNTITNNNFALITGRNTTPRWDWIVDNKFLFVASLDVAGTSVQLNRYDLSVGSTSFITFTVAGVTALAVSSISATHLGVFWATSAGVFYRSYTKAALAAGVGPITIHNVAGTYELIGATYFNNGTDNCLVCIQEDVAPSQTYNKRIVYGSIVPAGTGFAGALQYGCGLASKPATISRTWCSTYDTLLQRSLLIHHCRGSGTSVSSTLVGRTFYGTHGGLQVNHCLPQALDVAQDSVAGAPVTYDFFCAQPVQKESVATGAAPSGSYSPGYVYAQHAGGVCASGGMRPYPYAIVDNEIIFGGGYLHSVSPINRGLAGDGISVVPHGFLLTPEIVSATGATIGGVIADGTYSVICTYEYVDHKGRVFESGVSLPVSATITAGGGSGRIAVTVQNYRMEAFRNVFIVFYRTLNGGVTYYRERRIANNPAANTTLQDLSLSNNALPSSPILYCNSGGETENEQPDGPVAMCSDQNRLWVIAGSNLGRIVPSKPTINGVGAAFYPDTYRQVSTYGGLTALARQDGKVIAFDSNSTYVASGDGPDSKGGNDNLSDFSILFPNVGAEKVNSILPAPTGLFVKSATEIWFIGRDQQLTRIGAEVESYTASSRFLGAAYHAVLRQARFLYGTEAGTTFELVYDEDGGNWSYNPRQASVDSAVPSIAYFNDSMFYILPKAAGSSTLVRESASTFTDDGVGYSLKLVTAWLKPAQVMQGFGRIYRALLLGDSLADHTLQVRVRFNYESAWSETHTITSANATIGGTAYQPEIRFKRQQCEAFQLEISDISPTGQGFSLSGLELQVGVMPGKTKPQNQKKRF